MAEGNCITEEMWIILYENVIPREHAGGASKVAYQVDS